MRQFLLAAALVAVPVAAFTAGYHVLGTPAAVAAPSLGDLAALRTIVQDTQAIGARGDLVAAEKRLTDFETAWDDAEATMRPLNPEAWGRVDDAADAALHALRAGTPEAAKVTETLAALDAVLAEPGAGTGGGSTVASVAGIAVTDATGHPLACEDMLGQAKAALPAEGNAAASELIAKATERCNADDDRNADAFSAQALALLKGK